jgi:subtilisin family serine protease
MKRYCYSRGRKVELDQLDDVIAIKSPMEEASAARGILNAVRGAVARGLPQSVKSEEARGFERAGWSFVQPTAETRSAMQAADAREMAGSVASVFRRTDGQLVIGTNLLTVKLAPKFSEAEARAKIAQEGLEIVRQLKFAPNLFEVRVGPGKDPIEMANALQEHEDTVYSEPVLLERVTERQPFVPTDPDYPQQWQWRNNGSISCTPGADISAEQAWEITRGAGVHVAVIDNGFDLDHEDLASAVVSESGYFKNTPDGSASFQQTTANFPDSNHGTFCAGMVAARANNGRGGCGAAPEASLLLIGTLNDQVGSQVTLARAIAYAADPSTEVPGADPNGGAHIIACSLGPNIGQWHMTGPLEDALTFAATRGRAGLGIPIFWAASNGNFPVQQDEVVSHPGVIAVGRSTCRDTEDNSAFGPKLEFLAPGVSVYSTRSGNGYGFSTGTSFAAPCAAGVGALLLAHRPELTAQQVRESMRNGCDKIGGAQYDANGHNDDYGYGRINALRTLRDGETRSGNTRSGRFALMGQLA